MVESLDQLHQRELQFELATAIERLIEAQLDKKKDVQALAFKTGFKAGDEEQMLEMKWEFEMAQPCRLFECRGPSLLRCFAECLSTDQCACVSLLGGSRYPKSPFLADRKPQRRLDVRFAKTMASAL
jgi:hypothetical protein